MKNWSYLALLALSLSFGTALEAQVVKKTGHAVKTGAKKAGHKTAEVTVKGKSKVADKTLKTHTGPNGETIYVDNQRRYYWIDKKGKKHYIAYSALKTKI